MIKKVLGALSFGFIALLVYSTAGWAHGPFDGGGGGILSGALIDWQALEERFNGELDFAGDFEFNDEQVYLQYGGGGFGGSDLRLGGVGVGAEWTIPLTGESPFDRIQISFDIQGLWIEQFISEFDRGGISIGGIIGIADMRLSLIQDFTGTFDDFLVQPPLKFAMTRDYWFVQPFISTEVQLVDFMGTQTDGWLLAGA